MKVRLPHCVVGQAIFSPFFVVFCYSALRNYNKTNIGARCAGGLVELRGNSYKMKCVPIENPVAKVSPGFGFIYI